MVNELTQEADVDVVGGRDGLGDVLVGDHHAEPSERREAGELGHHVDQIREAAATLGHHAVDHEAASAVHRRAHLPLPRVVMAPWV